jgi:hypothetical protein
VYVFSSGGTINIYGGTFTALSKNVLQTSYDAQYGNAAIINVYDGTFYGTFGIVANGTTMNVYGGSFDHDPSAYVPAGYGITEADGIYTVAPLTGVAAIGHVGYATLAEAITAAEAGDTVTLLDDVTIENALSINKSLTIDLNGYTFTNGTGAAARPITIASGTDVTIENGTIENPNTASWGLLENYGTFTLDGVTANEYGSDGGAFLRNWSDANMIVKNSTLNGIGTAANQLVRNHNNTSGNTLLVEDSTLTSESTTDYPLIIRGNGTTTFTRITVAGAMGGIGIEGNTVTITDSNFTDVAGEEYYGLWITNNYAGTNVTVNGGTFTGGRYGVLLGVDDGNQNKSDVNVTINGGTFVGINNDAIGISTKAKNQTTRTFTLTVKGGAFNSDPTDYVPAGYGITEADGIYTVAPLTGVAAIGHVAYETFDAAVAAAQDGDTIVLLADVTYGTDRVVPVWEIKAFNIDLNGKTFTTDSNQGITLSNNGYGASAICYGDNENTSPARNIKVSNGTIRTAYGAGLYFDAAVTATLENLTVAQNYPANVQSTDEYSTAVRLTCGATVNIYSGTYSGKNAIVISNSGGYANIYGGDFRGVLFINGGASSTKVLTIYGGTFDHDPSAYVAEGYGAKDNDNGTWTVLQGWTATGSGQGAQGDPGLDD